MKQARRRFKRVSASALLAGVIALLRLAAACQDDDSQVSPGVDGGDGGGVDSSNDAEDGTEVDSTAPPDCIQTGAPGTLDPSFGDGGIALLTFDGSSGAYPYAVRLTAGEKVLVGGAIGDKGVLVRLLANGTPDPTFGTNGVVGAAVTPNDAGPSGAYSALDIQEDGKIVAAATYQDSFVIVRLHSDGKLDPSFGDGGIVETHIEGTPRALRVLEDGRILVSLVWFGPVGAPIALARYNADGTLDPTFGDGGTAPIPTDSEGYYYSSGAMAVMDGGAIVVGGAADYGSVTAFFRYAANGQLETSYGDGGAVAVDVGRGLANTIAVDALGRIILGGGGTGTFVIARATMTGALDPTFASNGTASVHVGGDASVVAMNLGPDGKIVAAGTDAVARLGPDGTVDTSFGADGKQVIALGHGLYATALAEGCRLVVVGFAFPSANPASLAVLELNR